MNITGNGTCLQYDANFPTRILPLFNMCGLIMIYVIYLYRRYIYYSKPAQCIHKKRLIFFLILVMLTSLATLMSQMDKNDVQGDARIIDMYIDTSLVLSWLIVIQLVFLNDSQTFSRQKKILNVILFVAITLPFGLDIYYVYYWYKECLPADQRILLGICLNCRVICLFIFWVVFFTTSVKDMCIYKKKKLYELSVWMPSDSSSRGTMKFQEALGKALEQDGIVLKKIASRDLKYRSRVVVIGNCCSRISAQLNDFSELRSNPRQRVLFIIIYLRDGFYGRGNVEYVRSVYTHNIDIVEMFYNDEMEMERTDFRNNPDNMRALMTIKLFAMCS